MIGDNSIKRQSGQVLLISVMLMAVLLTVVFSASFVSRTDTQISKLEEENQKALAAAEAGIEAALKSGNIAEADFKTLNIPGGFTGSATIQTTSSNSFITPLIKKGDQYTFYLSAPGGTVDNPDFGNLGSGYNNKSLTICSNSNSFALSLSFMKSNRTIKRFAVNPPVPSTIINGAGKGSTDRSNCPSGDTFAYSYSLNDTDVGGNNRLLFIQLIGTDTGARVGITAGSGNLPLQGKTIVSQATSPVGVSKKMQLFQSYPQIPSEFFVTSF